MFSVDPIATADAKLCPLHVLVIPQQVANGGQVEYKMNLPVPVYLRPLDQKDASMKVNKSDNTYKQHTMFIYL